jgi:hypothetical protein
MHHPDPVKDAERAIEAAEAEERVDIYEDEDYEMSKSRYRRCRDEDFRG